MTMRLTTVRNTNQEAIIHFATSTAESGTITIASLAAATQELISGGTPTVNITRFVTTGEDGASLSVFRNSELIIASAPENAPFLDLTTFGVSEAQGNTDDVVITSNVSKAVTGYIVLRKLAGWATKVETVTYGAYDDVTRVGASTTMSGSPDKV